MSDYRFDTDYLEVGDTYEGGPIEQSYFISAVMAAGGEVEIDGDTVYILQLPKKVVKESVQETPKEVPKAKEQVYVSEPVKEESKEPETVLSEEPKVKTYARKPKAVSASENTEE